MMLAGIFVMEIINYSNVTLSLLSFQLMLNVMGSLLSTGFNAPDSVTGVGCLASARPHRSKFGPLIL